MSSYSSIVIVGPCGPEVGKSLSEFLASVGIPSPQLIKNADAGAIDIIALADAEGGVPILILWHERMDEMRLIQELLYADTLPGRSYILITPSDTLHAILEERLEEEPGYNPEDPRVLVFSLKDLELASVRETVKLHLATHSCASHLGRTSHARREGVRVALVTQLPVAEREINRIDGRVIQRGMFRVQALKIPRF